MIYIIISSIVLGIYKFIHRTPSELLGGITRNHIFVSIKSLYSIGDYHPTAIVYTNQNLNLINIF